MTKWEYLVVEVGTPYEATALQVLLNRLGENGWELVSAPHAGNVTAGTALILKRPRSG